jgi:hypothetical protein
MANTPGLTLADIGVATEAVTVDGKEGPAQVDVRGVSTEDVLTLLQRFPELQKWIGGGERKASDLISLAPHAVSAIIAAATGGLDDTKIEAAAAQLPIETQLNFLEAIGRLTFKSGFGPFAERITALFAAAKSVSYGKAQATNLQPELKPSSPPVIPQPPSGSTPPAE